MSRGVVEIPLWAAVAGCFVAFTVVLAIAYLAVFFVLGVLTVLIVGALIRAIL